MPGQTNMVFLFMSSVCHPFPGHLWAGACRKDGRALLVPQGLVVEGPRAGVVLHHLHAAQTCTRYEGALWGLSATNVYVQPMNKLQSASGPLTTTAARTLLKQLSQALSTTIELTARLPRLIFVLVSRPLVTYSLQQSARKC